LLILDGQGNHEIFAGTYSDYEEKRALRAKQQAAEDNINRQRREEQERKRLDAEKRKAEQDAQRTKQSHQANHQTTQQTTQQTNQQTNQQASQRGNSTQAAAAMAKNAVAGSNPKFVKMKTTQLEAKIEELTKRAQELDFAMMAEDAWKDTQAMQRMTSERNTLRSQLAELEEEWMVRAG
jgi:hypothetical protein